MSGNVFRTDQEHRQFFYELETLLQRFDIFTGFDEANEERHQHELTDHPDEYEEYDRTSPKIVSGVAVVIQVSNLDGWHTVAVTSPPEQNPYYTKGLMEAAAEIT